MKKQTVAALAAASFVLAGSAQALDTDITLDGQIGFSVGYFDDEEGDNFSLHNNASRIGIEASASSGGYTGFARYERGMDVYNPHSDFTPGSSDSLSQDFVREFYAGLETPWGRATAGRMRAAYARAGQRVDPFYDTSVGGFSGTAESYAGQGAGYGLSNLSNGFSDRVLELQSGDYGGLQVNATFYFDRRFDNDHDYGVGVSYANELVRDQPFEVSVQHLEVRNETASLVPFDADASVAGSPGKSRNTRVAGVYDLGFVAIGANFERVDVDAERRARNYWAASGTVPLSPEFRIAATIGVLDLPSSGGVPAEPFSGLGGTLGAFYEVLPGLNTYAALRYVELDDHDAGSSWGAGVGASYNFNVTLR